MLFPAILYMDIDLTTSYSKKIQHIIQFKNASAFLLRDARHAMHDILLLRISAILPEAISDGGLTPTTDTDLLLATYRGGSHLTSDIIIPHSSVRYIPAVSCHVGNPASRILYPLLHEPKE